MKYKCEEGFQTERTSCKEEAKPVSLGKALLARALRLLRTGKGTHGTLSVEECGHAVDQVIGYSVCQKEAETATLEAERAKAKALMQWQRHSLIP